MNDSSAIASNVTNCAASKFLDQYYDYSLISQVGLIAAVSIFVTAATCFMQRRNRFQKCCRGVPGLPSPMDFLVTPRHRWVYVGLFFVMAASLINTYDSLNNITVQNMQFRIFYNIIILPVIVITVMTIQFFPLFVCVDAAPFPVSTISHGLGLLYSLVWLGGVISYEANTYLQYYVLCNDDGDFVPSVTQLGAAIAEDTPLFLTGGCIVLWYLYHFATDLIKVVLDQCNIDIDDIECACMISLKSLLGMKRKISKDDVILSGMKSYHVEHIRYLLVKPPQKDHGKVVTFIIKVFKYFFPCNHYDRLPVPYLGSVAAVIMLLYQFSLKLLAVGFLVDEIVMTNMQQLLPALNFTGNIDVVDAVVNKLGIILRVLIIVPPFVSFLLVLILIVHMTGAISKDLKKAAKYGISEKLPSALSIVPGMWKYIGIQIGYALSAWIIYTLIAVVIDLIITLIVIGLIHFTEFVITSVVALLIPFLFPKLIYYTQYLICRFVFFEDRQGKFISITNRRLFNWFAFILFFYNGIAGLFGALLRALMSFLFGLLLLFRLDRIVLMKGFEAFDFGHKKYLGFLYLYSTYNNAVVHVFIRLLANSRTTSNLRANVSATSETTFSRYKRADFDDDTKEAAHDSIELMEAEPADQDSPVPSAHSHTSHRIKNRWLVAYTLIQNPSLVALTATNLQQTQSEEPNCKTIDHGNSSDNVGSIQHSSLHTLPPNSELSPGIHQSDYHDTIHDHSDFEDTHDATDGHKAYNDSESTAERSLVVTADSSGIEQILESDCQNIEGHRKLRESVDVDANLTREGPYHDSKLESKAELETESSSKSDMTGSERDYGTKD